MTIGSSGCKMKSNIFGCREVLENIRVFIVNILVIWLKSTGREVIMGDFIDYFHLWAALNLRGFDEDGVTIIFINDCFIPADEFTRNFSGKSEYIWTEIGR